MSNKQNGKQTQEKRYQEIEMDLADFLLDKLYGYMDDEDKLHWCLADATDLVEDIRKHDGIECDPQEVWEIIQEFIQQDEEDEEL